MFMNNVALGDDIFRVVSCVGCVLLLSFICRWLLGRPERQKAHDPRGHIWVNAEKVRVIPYNVLCSHCGSLIVCGGDGNVCVTCGVSRCGRLKCLRNTPACRPASQPPSLKLTHHWVNVGAECKKCTEDSCWMGWRQAGRDFHCCWCQRTVHHREPPTANIFDSVHNVNATAEQLCDAGSLASMIVPPNCVSIMGNQSSAKQATKLAVVTTPADIINWKPVIVMANRKSGSNMGEEVLNTFRSLLNPVQVVELSKMDDAASALQRLVASSGNESILWRILVAGGDGTVANVLNAVADGGFENRIALGVLPLGTGNDLSRVLGWGSTVPLPLTPQSPTRILRLMAYAPNVPLDRWCVTITPSSRRKKEGTSKSKVIHTYNYMSVGVDAQVTLDFHNAREQLVNRNLFTTRTLNYLVYLCMGARRAMVQNAGGAIRRAWADDREIDLPPDLQALVLLSISSWGAGVDLWHIGADEDVPQQRYDDGIIEVIGITSSFHIAQLQCGLSQPIRFGQAKEVKLELAKECAMQSDGEPWLQAPATITLKHAGRVSVLLNPSPPN